MHVCCLTVDAKNIYYSRACGRKTRYQICIKSINPNLDSLLLWLYFIMGPLCFWAPYFRLHSKLLFLVLICSYCLKNKTLERITLSTPITGHVKRWVIGLWGICSSFKFCNPKFINIYIYIYNVLYWHKVSGSVLHVAYGIVLHRNRHWLLSKKRKKKEIGIGIT